MRGGRWRGRSEMIEISPHQAQATESMLVLLVLGFLTDMMSAAADGDTSDAKKKKKKTGGNCVFVCWPLF